MTLSPNTPLTPKQEFFCQKYVELGVASEAYRIAYPSSLKWLEKTVWEKASKLMANGKVKTRVKELQVKMQEKAEITALTLLKELEEIEELAKQAIHGKSGQAYDLTNWLNVKREKAKLLGLYAPTINKNQTLGADGKPIDPQLQTIININKKYAPESRD